MTDPGPAAFDRPGPRRRRALSRGRAVAGFVLLAGLTGATAAAPWVTARTTTALGEVPLAVAGSAAAPVVPAGALALAAVAVALGLAGRVARRMVGLAGGLVGVVVGGSALVFLRDPAVAALAAAADAGGVRALLGGAETTAWPVFAVGLGALSALWAGAVVVASGSWGSTASRYRPAGDRPAGGPGGPAGPARLRALEDWDALSRGEDPTR